MPVTEFQSLQKIGLDFFQQQTERSYSIYFKSFFPIAYSSAYEILKDADYANLVCSELFVSLWSNRDKFKFDDSKSHVGYIRLSSHNKAKIQLKKKNGYRESLESSYITEDNEEGLADKIFYNNGNTAIPDKRKKERNYILDRISIDTEVYVSATFHSHTTFTASIKYNPLTDKEEWMIENPKDMYRRYGKGTVTGEYMDNVIVEFPGLPDEYSKAMFLKTEVTIIGRDRNGEIHLKLMDTQPMDCINVHRTNTVDHTNADFVKFDETKETLYDSIMNNYTDYHDKIKDIISGFEDGGLLYDAIILKQNYTLLAKKYKLGTSGAVKTRVFRAKKRLCEIVESEDTIRSLNLGKKYTGKLSYFDSKGRLLYKVNYVDSKLHGQFCAFHPNSASTVQVQCNFNMGQLEGTYKEYNIDSKQIVEGVYVKGKEDGVFIYYDNNRIIKKIHWFEGEPSLLYEYKNGMKIDCRLMELDENEHPIELLQFNKILYGRIKNTTNKLQEQRHNLQPA